jgi:hypothetical protein
VAWPASVAREEEEGADGQGPHVSDREGRQRGAKVATPRGKHIWAHAPLAHGPTGPGEGGGGLQWERWLARWPGPAGPDSKNGF